ncbi:MAG: Ig-like domain-containing protein [Myxococcales bacterium]|nr:Ig-like domain-containing protein [Myxococcales bacterium]
MHRSFAIRCVAVATLVSFVSSCGPRAGSKPPAGGGGSGVVTPGRALTLDSSKPGLTMRLSDGKAGAPAADRSTLPPTQPITDAAAKAILDRVSPIGAKPDDTQAFALRDRSQPPPRTGKTIKGTFPVPNPQAGPPPATNDAGKPLTILRWAPEGDVPLAPQLQLTFSQPMVAVTSQDDAASVVPVKLTPTPPGRWRWLGTKTIIFDPVVRFPQATTYTVEIAKGTTSATGNALAAGKTFTFTTPTPRVETSWPGGGPQQLDAPMFVRFDQRIDPAAVLATIKITAAGKTYAARLLTADEIAKHETLTSLVDSTKAAEQDGRWLAFAATEAFPKDTHVEVTIGPGTPSAEGPNKTPDRQSFGFDTYPPLQIVRAECGWGECPPGAPFQIEFNNPLDVDRFDAAQVVTAPTIERSQVLANGNYLTVQGLTKGQTSYKTVVSGGVLDQFGQTLGKDATLTWKTGKAYPNFYGPSGLVVLDPGARTPTLDVFTTNYDALKVQLYQVSPSDYAAYGNYLENQWQRKKPSLPGKKVVDTLVRVKGAADDLTETKVELAGALKSGLGHVIAVIEPSPWKERYEPPRLIAWVQSTRLGVDAAVDAGELHAWVNKLADGAPVADAALSIEPWGLTATSGDDGTAVIALSAQRKGGAGMLVAKKGDDVAFVPDGYGYWADEPQWRKQERGDALLWHITDDRQMYRPGEDVHVKGWLRVHQGREGGDVAGIAGQVSSVTYKVIDPVGNELTKGTVKVSALGGFDLAFTLPKTPNLGYASIQLEAKGRVSGSGYHGFQIQEFRRPEYEVSAKADDAIKMIGGSADVTVRASYFAGGGLAGAEVNWYLTASETTFTPPNRDDFTFGKWVPWWGWGRRWWDEGPSYQAPQSWNHQGKTDATGAHVLHLDFLGVNPPVPMSVNANAAVTDVNRQAWNASTTLLVHPAAHYVGMRAKKPYVDKGQAIEIEAIDVDLDGKAVVGKAIDVQAVRLDWKYDKGKYVETEEDVQACALTSAAAAGTCSFATPEGGQYRITGVVTDDQGRKNSTELTVWVSGGKTPPARDVEQEQVQLIPSQKDYKPGDTAELLVQAPFYPAEGVMSVRRSGIVTSTRFTMTGPTQKLTVPITDGFTPNLYVQVDLIGMSARVGDDGQPDAALPKRPAYGVGSIDLSVPPKHRTLAVTIAPPTDKLAPGAKTSLAVTVKDAAGKPVSGAEVAVIAVDEAVLSLTGYQFANPIDTFYQRRDMGASDHRLRGFVKLAQPDASQLAQNGAGPGGGGRAAPTTAAAPEAADMAGGMPAPPPPPAPPADKNSMEREEAPSAPGPQPGNTGAIAVRTNMNPLAAFSPEVKTGADGQASVALTLPDNLTRYRLIAIAVAGDKQFGKGESALTARLPVMVRPSPPRFLNFGDKFELPVVVQNQTDAPLAVDVAVRASNATLTAGGGKASPVPANDRVEVRFPAAAEMAGTARFQIVGAGQRRLRRRRGRAAGLDAGHHRGLRHLRPDRRRRDQAAGRPARPGGHAVRRPPGRDQLDPAPGADRRVPVPGVVPVRVQRADQLAHRRHRRPARRARRVQGPGPARPAALEAKVGEDLERLGNMQNCDGGFVLAARLRVVAVPDGPRRQRAGAGQGQGLHHGRGPLDSGPGYLRDIERHYPYYYGEDIRRTITSYALYAACSPAIATSPAPGR